MIIVTKQTTRCDSAGTTQATVEINRVSVDITAFDCDGLTQAQQFAKVNKVLDLFKAISKLL